MFIFYFIFLSVVSFENAVIIAQNYWAAFQKMTFFCIHFIFVVLFFPGWLRCRFGDERVALTGCCCCCFFYCIFLFVFCCECAFSCLNSCWLWIFVGGQEWDLCGLWKAEAKRPGMLHTWNGNGQSCGYIACLNVWCFILFSVCWNNTSITDVCVCVCVEIPVCCRWCFFYVCFIIWNVKKRENVSLLRDIYLYIYISRR